MVKADWWITAEYAINELRKAGYEARLGNGVEYKKLGVSGRLTIHRQGVDGWAMSRLLDRGS